MKFQTTVEGLLQALTRKHILSQRPLQGDGGVGQGTAGRGEGASPLCEGWWLWLRLACLLLEPGWTLARWAGTSFGTAPVGSRGS